MPHHRHLISVFLLLFWFSGYLKVVWWQIQRLEKTSQEEVSEHRQPDSHAVVPRHHLLTLAYQQQGDRPVRCTVQYLCLVSQGRQTWEAVLWINRSVSNTHINTLTQSSTLWLHPLWLLYIHSGCPHWTKQTELNQTWVYEWTFFDEDFDWRRTEEAKQKYNQQCERMCEVGKNRQEQA